MITLIFTASKEEVIVALWRDGQEIDSRGGFLPDKDTGRKLLEATHELLAVHDLEIGQIEKITVQAGEIGYSSGRALAVTADMLAMASGAEVEKTQ